MRVTPLDPSCGRFAGPPLGQVHNIFVTVAVTTNLYILSFSFHNLDIIEDFGHGQSFIKIGKMDLPKNFAIAVAILTPAQDLFVKIGRNRQGLIETELSIPARA